ncbi:MULTISPECIES: TauD/TfdA family dioxygenase [unclassified Streptomyces]|uniref:TauD/TfdA dioxygenase family protein n=1 Tax=unclassified Streptomyces TaxID=2593676 RepID=UPI00224F8970|nr:MULTISPECIES: TauD/TfdA family dioxygenase [unclassified Streptomyces]MCX4988805.1 TauD/TfdA family dioxygenase [Streptomyces sp. NBC_00568]MCX5005973.1 TauD/TfdA family dioxygenase [Streptomyces sp. NBC_00638]
MDSVVTTPAPALDKPLMHYGKRTLDRITPGMAQPDYRLLDICPLTPHIGAEVEGVDLSLPIGEDVAEEIRQALLEWKVLFFRGQDAFDPQSQLAFSGLWGEPEPNPFFPKGDTNEVTRLAKDDMLMGTENIWHSDHSFMAAPALGSVLRAVEVPPAGGDTMWADMAAAYDNLTESMKARIEGLTAVHDWVVSHGLLMTESQIAGHRENLPPVEHPVVVHHPRTGRKVLYVNEPFTTRIVGLSDVESRELLNELVLQARIPEYQVRFRWQPGSVAVWDNIATQHYAISDYFPRRRVMERIAIAGVPLS